MSGGAREGRGGEERAGPPRAAKWFPTPLHFPALAAISARVVRHAGHMSMTPLVAATGRLLLFDLPNRSHLDAPEARRWDPRRYLNGIVEVPGLDEKVAAELLLGLGEGAVGG